MLFWAPQLPVTTSSQLKHLKPLILLLPKPGFPNSVTGPSFLQPSSVEPRSSLPHHPYFDQSVISLTKSFFFLQSFHFQPNSGPTAIRPTCGPVLSPLGTSPKICFPKTLLLLRHFPPLNLVELQNRIQTPAISLPFKVFANLHFSNTHLQLYTSQTPFYTASLLW